MARPFILLILLTALPSCRPSPSDAERRWEQRLGESLPPGWTIVAVVGDPKHNSFVCWLAAPGKDKEYRVEVRIKPRSGGRSWTVLVHPPAKRPPEESVKFHVPNDGEGALKLFPDSRDRAAFVEEARPLAEEAVRQVRALELF